MSRVDGLFPLKINGRTLTKGTEVSIENEKGRFRFQSYDPRGWTNVYGGKPNQEKLRAFKPEQVETVHRTRKMGDKRED